MIRQVRCLLLVLTVILLPGICSAQSFPARPIRIVVAYTAGGSGDIVARAVAQKMAEGLGQQVVVDNRPGANGNIGTEHVAKSPPDGYTLLMGSDIQFAISPNTYAKLPFDPERDFEPVSMVALLELVLAAHPSLPAANVRELISVAKANPGKINYASTGPGSTHHLSIEMLKILGGMDLTHVPYKGSAQALPDLISGQVQVMLLGIPQTLPYLKSGKLKALAVGAARRSVLLPDVPTIAEAGFPGFEANNNWSLFAPAGTSKEIVSKLYSEIVRIVSLPDIRERFIAMGLEPVGSTPAELAARMRNDRAKWARVIRETGIRIE